MVPLGPSAGAKYGCDQQENSRMEHTRNTIRHLEPDLLIEARILALQTGQRLGDVINDALIQYFDDIEVDDESSTQDIAA